MNGGIRKAKRRRRALVGGRMRVVEGGTLAERAAGQARSRTESPFVLQGLHREEAVVCCRLRREPASLRVCEVASVRITRNAVSRRDKVDVTTNNRRDGCGRGSPKRRQNRATSNTGTGDGRGGRQAQGARLIKLARALEHADQDLLVFWGVADAPSLAKAFFQNGHLR